MRALARIAAEIKDRTAPPDPDSGQDQHLDRGLSLDTTAGAAGVIHGYHRTRAQTAAEQDHDGTAAR